jgi:hypothetical protein
LKIKYKKRLKIWIVEGYREAQEALERNEKFEEEHQKIVHLLTTYHLTTIYIYLVLRSIIVCVCVSMVDW